MEDSISWNYSANTVTICGRH